MTNILVNSSGKAYLTSGNKVLTGKVLGTKTITENGTYAASSDSLDGYSSVTVNVGGANLGIPREIVNDTYQMPSSNFNYVLPAAAKNLGQYALFSAFYCCTGLISANMDALETCNGTSAMQSCFIMTNIVTASFASLYQIYGNNALNTAFAYATKLTDVYFNSLTTSSFGTIKNQFTSMLQSTGTTTTHTLHFPSNLESTISTLTGYPTFGGSSGYVTLAYDLPATS